MPRRFSRPPNHDDLQLEDRQVYTSSTARVLGHRVRRRRCFSASARGWSGSPGTCSACTFCPDGSTPMNATVADLPPEDARERQAAVRGAVRLGAGAQHLPEDRAGSRVAGGAWPARAERLHRRALRQCEAAGRPDRRGRPGRGRAVRRVGLSAPAAGAAVLPDAVRREALQPHPGDGAAGVSRTRCCSSSRAWRTPRSRRTTRAASSRRSSRTPLPTRSTSSSRTSA